MAERSKGTPAGERLRRLLLVVPYAITHPGSRIEDLAEMFGTAPEELEEDIAVLGFNYGLYVGWGLKDERHTHEAEVRTSMDRMFAWCEEGKLRPTTSHIFPLAQFADAMAARISGWIPA